MSDIRLRLLGPTTIQIPGGVVLPPSGRVSALLCLLGVRAGETVTFDRLADQLWPADQPRSAVGTLQVYVSRLRKQLADSGMTISTGSRGYTLIATPETVDIHVFSTLVGDSELLAGEHRWQESLEQLGAARALWSGQPFANAAGAADLVGEADRLLRMFHRAEELTARALLGLGRPAEAEVLIRKLISVDELNETYRRLLMRVALSRGDAAVALGIHREYRELLADELGIDPSERMQRLYLQSLQSAAPGQQAVPDQQAAPVTQPVDARPNSTRLDSTRPISTRPINARPIDARRFGAQPIRAYAGADAPVEVPSGEVSLIAREREKAQIAAAIAAARSGSGRVLILEGEPGIGKSALAAHAADVAAAQDVRVGWARAIDGPGTPPLWMWEQILAALASSPEQDPDSLPASSRRHASGHAQTHTAATGSEHSIAALAALSRVGEERGSADQEQSRFRLAEAIIAKVVDVSGGTPLLLVFDDVQWADDGTAQALRLLGTVIGSHACSLLIAARPAAEQSPAVASALAALGRERSASRITLEPFTADDVARYVRQIWRKPSSAEDSSTDQLFVKTGGNPFFLTELLRAAPSSRAVPATVAELVQQRISDLPPHTRALLNMAAVGGRSIDPVVLGVANEKPVREILVVLEQAMARNVLVIEPGTAQWVFVHDLTRDAIVEQLAPSARLDLHRRLAEAIADVHADDIADHIDELAHHRYESVAGAPSREAFESCSAAADSAVRRLAYDQAARQRARALATLPTGVTQRPERFEVLLRLTVERRLAGDVTGASTSLRQAIELAKRMGDQALSVRAVSVLGGVTLWNWRQFDEVDSEIISLLRELLAENGPVGVAADGSPLTCADDERIRRIELLGTLAVELYYSDERVQGEGNAVEAVRLARTLGDPAVLGRALNNFVIAAWVPGRDVERLQALDESLAYSGRGLPLATEIIARMHRASLYLRRGDIRSFESDLDRASWLVPRSGILELEGQVTSQHAGFAILRGDLETASELMDRAYRQMARTSLWGAEWVRWMQIISLARIENTVAEVADGLVAKAHEESLRALRWTAVLAVAEAGELAEARALQARWGLRQLNRRLHWGSTFEWAQAGEIALLTGAPDAREVYRALSTVAREFVTVGTGLAVWGPVTGLMSRLAAAAGRPADARRDQATAQELTGRLEAELGVAPRFPEPR